MAELEGSQRSSPNSSPRDPQTGKLRPREEKGLVYSVQGPSPLSSFHPRVLRRSASSGVLEVGAIGRAAGRWGAIWKAPASHQGPAPPWRPFQSSLTRSQFNPNRTGPGGVGTFPGTGSKKQQPKGLKRLPALESTGKRLLLGGDPLPHLCSGRSGLPLMPNSSCQDCTEARHAVFPENREAPAPVPTSAALD